jgi:ABC-type nitrate/sulfonate/bicarbonate transport system permease component
MRDTPLVRRLLENSTAMSVLSPVLLLVLWQAAVDLRIISGENFTSPLQVARALREVALGENTALRGSLAVHTWTSVKEVGLGFLLAAGVGVPLGILQAWSRILNNFIDPVVELVRPIPPTAWVAVSLLLFGLGLQEKVFVVFVGTFAPVLITTLAGARGLDPINLKVARTHNAFQLDILTKVFLPALVPTIMTAIRTGLGLAWMVVVAAELIAADAGLGFLLIQAYRIFRMDIMVAVMSIIGLTAFVMDRLLREIQHRVLRWQE